MDLGRIQVVEDIDDIFQARAPRRRAVRRGRALLSAADRSFYMNLC